MDAFQTGERVTPAPGAGRCRRANVWRFSEGATCARKATRETRVGRAVDRIEREVASAVPKIQTELSAA